MPQIIQGSRNSEGSAALLTISGLGLTRGDRELVKSFDLTLASGEAVHLVGRNGAGKTTLLETLAGLRSAATGEVRSVDSGQLHWLGHRNGCNPALSARENLRFWCGLNAVEPAGVEAALKAVDLHRIAWRPLRTYSAGQQRRTALARLLLASRPLWLLDEPMSALDQRGLEIFAGMLLRHLDQGGGCLVTSHQALPVAAERVRVVELRG